MPIVTPLRLADKKVSSKAQFTTGEVSVLLRLPISRPESVEIIGCYETLPSDVKNALEQIMELMFKFGLWMLLSIFFNNLEHLVDNLTAGRAVSHAPLSRF